MLHLAVVNSTTTLQILQVLVLNLGLPWALATQHPDVMGKEWHPSHEVQAVQDDIIEALEKVSAQTTFPVHMMCFSVRLFVRYLCSGQRFWRAAGLSEWILLEPLHFFCYPFCFLFFSFSPVRTVFHQEQIGGI